MGLSPVRHLIPVRSEQLQPGMFVAELDRSWLHAPFPAAGFLITDAAQVEQLRQICHHVYVDAGLSEFLPATRSAGRRDAPGPGTPPPLVGHFAATRQMLSQAIATMAGIVQLARRQSIVDSRAVARCAAQLVAQVTRDAETLHGCLRLAEQGGYLCRRAVGTAAVAATLAHHLGFDDETLQGVATGALLLDLGKIAVPVPILAKPGALAASEQAYVRRHVERGLELIAGAGLPGRAIEMIAAHHERTDGSGYPEQLRGTTIPLFGRLAAIADAYDAMTLNRRYAAAVSPHTALRQLSGPGDGKFDAALVAELVDALGVYPAGSLVELADGRVGLVRNRHRGQPLQADILVTHDLQRTPLSEPMMITADGATDIFRALPPGAVRITTAGLDAALDHGHSAAG